MDRTSDDGETRWLEVVAKATAMLALQGAEVGDEGTYAQAKFLEGLGISGADAAAMLGINAGSLRKAKSRARKGGGRGKAKGDR